MSRPRTVTETHVFKKGERLLLDSIYNIQGLGDGKWWEPDDDDVGENITITKDIKIVIKVTQ